MNNNLMLVIHSICGSMANQYDQYSMLKLRAGKHTYLPGKVPFSKGSELMDSFGFKKA